MNQQYLPGFEPVESQPTEKRVTKRKSKSRKSGVVKKTLNLVSLLGNDSQESTLSDKSYHTRNHVNGKKAERVSAAANAQASKEPKIYSVSEINRELRNIIENQFGEVWLKGEISNLKLHTSGHYYFSLKDDKTQINAVMFRGAGLQLKFRPEAGQEVIVRGRISVFEPRGSYQIVCDLMEPVGHGALQVAFEQLKVKLQKEGLFDLSRKRQLPMVPKHIGVVTSPTGAAIRDILNVIARRHRGVRVTLVPTLVQGAGAAKQIAQAIALANCLEDIDVLIVGRGGGSIEDLWAFNEEVVARAIANSRIPIISAVGHEIDFTIADFVADLRAPTPSAAAELVVKSAADLADRVTIFSRSLIAVFKRMLAGKHQAVDDKSRRLIDPKRRLQDLSLRCDELSLRLENLVGRRLRESYQMLSFLRSRLGAPSITYRQQALQFVAERLNKSVFLNLSYKQTKLKQLIAVLDSLSPLAVIARGYAVVTKQNKIITSISALAKGERVAMQFVDGKVVAAVESIVSAAETESGG